MPQIFEITGEKEKMIQLLNDSRKLGRAHGLSLKNAYRSQGNGPINYSEVRLTARRQRAFRLYARRVRAYTDSQTIVFTQEFFATAAK